MSKLFLPPPARLTIKRSAYKPGIGRRDVEMITGTVHLSIDLDAILHELGARALGNKNRRAVGMRGAIKAQAVNIAREKVEP